MFLKTDLFSLFQFASIFQKKLSFVKQVIISEMILTEHNPNYLWFLCNLLRKNLFFRNFYIQLISVHLRNNSTLV